MVATIGQPSFDPPSPRQKWYLTVGGRRGGGGVSKSENSLGDNIVSRNDILQGAGHPITSIGVSYANISPKRRLHGACA